MTFFISIQEAEKMGFCKHCGFAGRLAYQNKPCNYHQMKSLNYRKIPNDKTCALKPMHREVIISDYGMFGGVVR